MVIPATYQLFLGMQIYFLVIIDSKDLKVSFCRQRNCTNRSIQAGFYFISFDFETQAISIIPSISDKSNLADSDTKPDGPVIPALQLLLHTHQRAIFFVMARSHSSSLLLGKCKNMEVMISFLRFIAINSQLKFLLLYPTSLAISICLARVLNDCFLQ